MMAVRPILQLGDPALYEPSAEVRREDLEGLDGIVRDLADTMAEFRARYGAGRAIAAPQIAAPIRLVYMDRGEPLVLIDPVISRRSEETIELWDDCMSFPDLLVRVRRSRAITVRYRDMGWKERTIEAQDDLSELLQHEIDHLDGILATMRAIDERSFACRSERGRLKG
jgi:peptide deformylase